MVKKDLTARNSTLSMWSIGRTNKKPPEATDGKGDDKTYPFKKIIIAFIISDKNKFVKYIRQAEDLIKFREVGIVAELKVELFIERNGKIEPFNGFTESELSAIRKRLSRTMSAYYTNHIDEYIKWRESIDGKSNTS